jgi:hypothetical protein
MFIALETVEIFMSKTLRLLPHMILFNELISTNHSQSADLNNSAGFDGIEPINPMPRFLQPALVSISKS